jgi:ketosteroid isomerase-like protein
LASELCLDDELLQEHDMNFENNRATAVRFFELFSANDIDGALALMTEDSTWRIPGKKELSPAAGLYTKDEIARLFRRMLDRLSGGLTLTVVSSLAEGDRVSLEVTSSGDLKNGRAYRQEYHFVMELRGGMICAVREYLDTHHTHDVWFAQSSSQDAPANPQSPPAGSDAVT